MRGGPSGIFVDFDLLPDLLAKAVNGRANHPCLVGTADRNGI